MLHDIFITASNQNCLDLYPALSGHVIPKQKLQCGSNRSRKPHVLRLGPDVLIQPYLVSLFAPGDGAGERLLLSTVHAHGAQDGLGADGAFCGPWLIAVRLLVVYLFLVILAAWRRQEQDTYLSSLTDWGRDRSPKEFAAQNMIRCLPKVLTFSHVTTTNLSMFYLNFMFAGWICIEHPFTLMTINKVQWKPLNLFFPKKTVF